MGSPFEETDTLPARVRRLLWEYDPETLDWHADRDLIVRRVLVHGDWEAVSWLRRRLGDDVLRRWLTEREGDVLSPRQLRFWQVVLGLPEERVDRWVEARRDTLWTGRVRP